MPLPLPSEFDTVSPGHAGEHGKPADAGRPVEPVEPADGSPAEEATEPAAVAAAEAHPQVADAPTTPAPPAPAGPVLSPLWASAPVEPAGEDATESADAESIEHALGQP